MSVYVYFETNLDTDVLIKQCAAGFKTKIEKLTEKDTVASIRRDSGERDEYREFDDIPKSIGSFERMNMGGHFPGEWNKETRRWTYYSIGLSIEPKNQLVFSNIEDVVLGNEEVLLKFLDIICSIIKPSAIYIGDEIPTMERVKAECEPNKMRITTGGEWKDYSAKVKAIVEKHKKHE